MKISSKLKKIMSFLLVTMLVMSAVVLPVSADTTKQVIYPAGTYPDDSYHPEYEYFGNCPKYTADDLVYTGDLSTDVRINFNIKKQYGLDWTTDTGFYMSRPFSLRKRWDFGDSSDIVNFAGNYANVNQLFSKERFDTIASSSFVKNNDIVMSGYDVYYTLRTSYSVTREYGYLSMTYIFVPKDYRIAISNQNKEEDGSGSIKYGIWLSPDGATSDITPIYNSCWSVTFRYGTEGGSVATYPNGFYDAPFSDWLGLDHLNLIATNIPIFTKADAAKQYIMSGESTEDPTNKIPNKSDSTEKVGADAFYWDSLKCRIVADGQSYRVIYNYTYSVQDMIENPNSYVAYTDYTQVINYKYNNVGTYQNFETEAHSSFSLASARSATDEVLLNRVSKSGDVQRAFLTYLDTYAASKHVDTDFSNGDLLSSYIYITVTLVNIVDGGNGLAIKNKVSSDVRTFKFDAITLEEVAELDPVEEIKSDVKVDDVTDADGKVIDRTVSQITTNDNSTHTTINNYYYDSDGNRSTSSGSSLGDSLSDIASGLINFIKTLVTEGLPAALEILKTLIKSVSDLVGFAFDQIGDIGTGSQNGIITVLKAIPTPLWGICSVGIIAYVIVGVIKKFF